MAKNNHKGGESLPLARASLLATPSSGGHPRNAPVDTPIEAPYELPEGWKWCRLGDVCKTFADGDWIESKDQSESGIRLVQTGNIGNGEFRDKEDKYHYISEETFKKLKCTEIFPGDILISRLPEPVGRSCIIPDSNYKMITAVDCTIIRLFENITCKNWFCYYTQSHVYAGLIHELCTGTTRLRISRKNLGEIPFPLPPTLAEQQRIVNRIETMFAKLDQAQEKAQTVLDNFEPRKAAILHKAFTGELTANWRKENGVSDESWEEKTVGECCSEVKVGIVIKPTRYYTEEEMGIPAFRSANVRENHIDDFDWVYINAEGMKNEKRSIVHTNDVLVVRSGAPGTACVVTEQFDGYNAIDILIAVPLQVVINSYFLCYYTNSPMGKNIVAEKKRGLGLTHFNVKGYSATPIRIPSLTEQQEIIRILDTVLEKESRAKEAAQTILDHIALLKKSILARAFRGEI